MKWMRLSSAILIQTAVVSAAISWKDSVSRTSVDLLRKHRVGRHSTGDFSTVANAVGDSDPSSNPYYVELPLDHFGQSPGAQTFRNRYYVQDAYYKPGGPVIFHDVGESSAENYAVGMSDEQDFSVSIAKRFNGLLIVFEHRFYGESAPHTSVARDLYSASPAGLTNFYKFLTIEQALEDVVVFASNFTYKFQDFPAQQLTPDKAPWVFIGVSYAGARGAWLAKRNPGLFKATLSSSAPIQLKVDFWEYFTAVEDALAINHKNCSADLHAAADWLSQAWLNRDPSLLDQFIEAVYQKGWLDILQQQSGFYGPETIWDARLDFMRDAAWTPFANFQYYGISESTLGRFCEIMETAYDPNGTPEGVFATETIERAAAAYAKAIASTSAFSYYAASRQNNKKRQTLSTTDGTLDSSLDDYSWLWQVCSEFGAFQVANMSRPENLVPSFINVTAQIDQCLGLFGESEQVNSAGPNVDAINQKYQGWYLELPNTLWTNGQFDPWRALSVDSENDDAPTNDTVATDIPQCGSNFPPGAQLRYLIRDGLHGSDVSEDVAAAADNAGNFGDLVPTKTIVNGITATLRHATSMHVSLTGTPITDAVNAQSLWISAMSSWIPCTTLQFTYTAAQATTPAPFSSRKPFPTDEPSVVSAATATETVLAGNSKKTNAAPSLSIHSSMIPFIVCILALTVGVQDLF
ncbi:hypothetical protein Dda_2419 [Drechslerella dactyloides]|uniref:Serine carboxypeptidase S28-domain-containing protein n=1 Tax=Drechslerella dactyloides TaxID=74499 RepID=A0AAD6J7G6_DREDA|nr:hypothetical protein Dda_2419 [Drechslerella dactyloides]